MNKTYVLFALALFLFSCKNGDPCQQGVSTGVLSKDWIYTNDSLKLKLQLPRDWFIVTGLSITAMSDDNDGYMEEEYVFTKEEVESAKQVYPAPMDRVFTIAKKLYEVRTGPPIIEFHQITATTENPTPQQEILSLYKHHQKYGYVDIDYHSDIQNNIELLMLPQGDDFYYFFTHPRSADTEAVGIILKGCRILKIRIVAEDHQEFMEVLETFRNAWLEY